jgi:hypothetical protein
MVELTLLLDVRALATTNSGIRCQNFLTHFSWNCGKTDSAKPLSADELFSDTFLGLIFC